MHIPRTWVKATTHLRDQDDRELDLVAWGWGSDRSDAEREAAARLERVTARVRRGEPFPDRYAYGDRPLREEILETIDGTGEPRAIVTRNKYGAQVLNTARLLFLDVDLPEDGGGGLIGRLFGRPKPEDVALAKLRDALDRAGKGSFRIYRTAAGFRALAVDHDFEPDGQEARSLMEATGTDPYYVRLCRAQKSFRARLTPKPWRIGLKAPAWDYPREDPAHERRFTEWLAKYARASAGYATCRYLETVGKSAFRGLGEQELVKLHDRATRATESLPLA